MLFKKKQNIPWRNEQLWNTINAEPKVKAWKTRLICLHLEQILKAYLSKA